MHDEIRERADLDKWITDNGESDVSIGYAIGNPPRGRTQPLKPEVAKAISETRERKQRQDFAEREANRTGQAQRERYRQHILASLPTQNGIQRIPTNEMVFWNLVADAYNTIHHEKGYHDFWIDARQDVWKMVRDNQVIVATAYASEMKRQMAAGNHDLKTMWQEIAHHADRDDANLKRQVWQILSK